MNFKNNINKKKYPEFLELDTNRKHSNGTVKIMEQLNNKLNYVIIFLILQLFDEVL